MIEHYGPRPNDRVSIEAEFHQLYNDLADRSSKKPETAPFIVLKDVFMWAVALGVRSGKRLPLAGKKDDLFFWHQLSQDQDVPVLESIAVAETGDVEVLAQGSQILLIAEEYANEGIRLLKQELVDQRAAPLWNLVALARQPDPGQMGDSLKANQPRRL